MIEPLKIEDKDGDYLEAHCHEATRGRAAVVVLVVAQDDERSLVELTVAQALQLRDWLYEFCNRSGE